MPYQVRALGPAVTALLLLRGKPGPGCMSAPQQGTSGVPIGSEREGLSGRGLVAHVQRVLQAESVWAQAQLLRTPIHVRFQGPDGLGRAKAANAPLGNVLVR